MEDCYHWLNKVKIGTASTVEDAMSYFFVIGYVMLWIIIAAGDLTNLSYKPKILRKLLYCVECLNKIPDEIVGGELFSMFVTAMGLVLKREMGISTQESELINVVRAILATKTNKSLSISLIVTIMMSVWVRSIGIRSLIAQSLQFFSEPETATVVDECWELLKEMESGFGLIPTYRKRLAFLRKETVHISFERLETLAELENDSV